MDLQSSEGRVHLVIEARGSDDPRAVGLSRGEHRARVARALSRIEHRVDAESGIQLVAKLALAPIALLSVGERQARRSLEDLRGWTELARVEPVVPEPPGGFVGAVEQAALRIPGRPIVGFVEVGRPDLFTPEVQDSLRGRSSIPAFELHGEQELAGHPGSVLQVFLDALGDCMPSCIVFESLRLRCGPFALLAALDRLLARGCDLINLSYGRRAIERHEGWAPLEWGTRLLASSTEALIVAAAGQTSELLPQGFHLYLPACVPEVIAADGRDRSWGVRGETDEAKIFLASRAAPTPGPGGSSYAAPRISALICRAMAELPPEKWRRAPIERLLRAASRPRTSSLPGIAEPELHRMLEILDQEAP